VKARSRFALVVLLAFTPSLGGEGDPAASADHEMMVVPGGTRAVTRLVGNVDPDPERFATSLNRILLGSIRADHDWQAIDARVQLVTFLETVAKLERRLRFPLELEDRSRESLDRLDALGSILGFKLHRESRPIRFEALEGEVHGRRQRIAWVLGWNPTQILHRLEEGEKIIVELPHDRVPSLVPLSSWREITPTAPTPENALALVATDQRLGLLTEGLSRMTRGTRDLLGVGDLRWIYHHAPVAFYRYSTSFEVRDGALRWPGGPSTAEAWTEWLGIDSTHWRSVFRALFDRSDLRAAHVWSALFFLPEPVARYFVESFIAPPWAAERIDVVLQGIRSIYGQRFFTRARGLGGGFQLLYRAVPFEGPDPSPRLPEVPALWFTAMQDGPVPRSVGAASKIAARSTDDGASPEAHLTRWMTARCRIGRTPGLVIQRFLRTAPLFEGPAELATPENVFLVNRADGRFPAAVDALRRMRLGRPESLRDYLVTVARLGEEIGSADRVVRFQGGVELVARLYETGGAEDPVLETALQSWAVLHDGTVSGARLDIAEAAWLLELLQSLPEAESGAPGRGPLERAWLAALVGGRDPQRFEWNGLAYEGHRARDRAERMLRSLEKQRIAPVDDVLAFEALLGGLLRACESGELQQARESSANLLRLEDLAVSAAVGGTVDPADLRAVLEGIRDERKVGKLAGHAARLTGLLAEQAAAVRPVLVAPAYLPALAGIENVLLTERLIGCHVVADRRAARIIPWTGPWRNAEVVPRRDGAGGGYICGPLGDVLDILIRIHVRSIQPGSESRQIGLLPREARWYRDTIGPTWSRVSPEVLDVVGSLVTTGSSILDDALAQIDSGGAALDFVVERIPLHRLENAAASGAGTRRVSPGDRLALGLAAVSGDEFGDAAPHLLDDGRREELLQAIRDVGRGPDGLDAVSAPTPHVNGRIHPWVGTWLPYEAFDREGPLAALVERELVDLRIAIAHFLARKELPGTVGADLEAYVLTRVPRELELESAEDWVTVLDWIGGLDDDYFDRGLRRCLERGFYRVQGF
jgi:hypothetical protein